MKLMSLFDGSGGFPLAASLCGIEPVYASEVEPYPIAVTVSRFPNMKHLGDVSRIKGAEIEPVDIITFGSPCQDMSVAGKRAGLKHTAVGDEETTRSGLFMEAIRIIKEMRVKTNGIYPRFAVWENVPGAFSSNRGEDFRLVLEEFIKITEPDAVMPAVPQAGWAYADCISGDGWSIAYRVFDAQHWGVPQRRRRIYLVADFRGECARKILFEHEGVRGYFETGRTPWQGIAADAQKCVGTDDRAGEIPCQQIIIDNIGGQTEYARQSDTAPCLKATHVVYDARGNGDGQTVSTITGDHNNRITDYTCLVVEPAVRCYDIGEARLRTPREYIEKTPTLTARCGTGGNNVPGVVYCLQSNGIDRADTAGCNGKGWRENECYTLNTIDRPAVCYQKVVGSLCATDYKWVQQQQVGEGKLIVEPCPYQKATGPLMANSHPGSYTGQDAYTDMFVVGKEKPVAVPVHYIVRRLTPTECARLQGFPDLWGHLDKKESFTDEEYKFWLEVRNTYARINNKAVKDYTKAQILTWYNKLHTDSAEYKMWGNGIALPNALYVMQGIAAEAEIPINLF
jgi:DNA (cytosine-5)-methyltransferase 1